VAPCSRERIATLLGSLRIAACARGSWDATDAGPAGCREYYGGRHVSYCFIVLLVPDPECGNSQSGVRVEWTLDSSDPDALTTEDDGLPMY
jgi:hypothetical protein